MVIIIIHSTFKNPPHTHHLLIRVCAGPREKRLGRSCQGTQGYLQLPCPQYTKSEGGDEVTSGEEARREQRDQVLVDGRIRKYPVTEAPEGPESPLLLWEGSKSSPSLP